jgi:hypothetical protein
MAQDLKKTFEKQKLVNNNKMKQNQLPVRILSATSRLNRPCGDLGESSGKNDLKSFKIRIKHF